MSNLIDMFNLIDTSDLIDLSLFAAIPPLMMFRLEKRPFLMVIIIDYLNDCNSIY